MKDGENNLTTFEYDGLDRLSKTRYPVPTKGDNASSTTDYEQLTYDANSNVTARRLRDGGNINLVYDNLNRLITLGPPNPEASRAYTYDNLGRMLTANKGGATLTFTYDALGRNLTQVSPQGTVTSAWDSAGRRTQLTYPGTGLYLNYDYLVTGEITKVRENGASSGIGVLATNGYDPATSAGQLGLRTSLTLGNGALETYGYDNVSRLTSLGIDASGTTNHLTKTFAFNPANQIVSETRSNTAYSQVLANATQTSVTNGLNELSTVNGTSAGYDARGNMTTDPATAKTYTYTSSNNQLLNTPAPFTSFAYDALDRLWDQETPTVTKYVSDGTDTIAEYDGSNVVQKRYAFDGSGQPLVQYDAAGVRTWMLPDERGSVVALANDSAVISTVNTYDEYGIPAAGNVGTFQYAGMQWLSRPAVYAPTFRAYAHHLGRFNQADPLGYGGDGPNLYAYVLNDPVNLTDPLGLGVGEPSPGDIVVIACPNGGYLSLDGYHCNDPGDIVVTHARLPGLIPQSVAQPGNPHGGLQGGGEPFRFDGTKFVPDKSYSSQCASSALQANALSIGLDLAGLIPGESTLVGVTRLSAGIFGTAYSAASGDTPGAILGGVGVGAETADMAGDVGRLIPFVGSLVSATSLGRDIAKTGQQILSCPGGH